ncbi:MAG: sulfatase [Candidatus Hodarchaeota archaeon]
MEKPNILIILTDQQSSTMMSCAGNSHVSTPSMDSLAKDGVRFTRAACTNPVCVPSRFSLFTGYMPEIIGVRHNGDGRNPTEALQDILPHGMGFLLREAGYKTYYGGKQHFPSFTSKDIGFEQVTNNERDELARVSAQFLSTKHEEPFLYVASFINPHDICYMAIDYYRDRYKRKGFFQKFRKLILESRNVKNILKIAPSIDDLPPLSGNHEVQEEEPEAVRSLFQREFKRVIRAEWNDEAWRQHRYVYARLTEKVDSQIGVVLKALDERPHADDTVVIFTSDHGDHDGSHKLEHKTALYSEAVEVPFIIKWKGKLPGGKTVSNIVNNGLDLVPTVCDIAGIDKPRGLEGRSIIPLALGKESKPRTWVPVESEIGRAIWSERWVYALYDEGEHREQLYDLKNDPGQTRNHLPEQAGMIETCREVARGFWPDIAFP